MTEATHRSTEYEINVVPGPRFYDQDGETMFQYIVDRTASIGPRIATKRDAIENPGAWDAYAVPKGIAHPTPPQPQARKPGRPRKT